MRRCLLALLLVACGDPPPPAELAPIEAPTRNAAGDASLRRMVAEMAEHGVCESLTHTFVPLPETGSDRRRWMPVQGRLWVSECSAERVEERLRVSLVGRGWQWVDEEGAGPLGSSFRVRGTVRFEASLTLEGELDLRYDAETRRAQVIVTPRPGLGVRVSPIGAVPVAPSGGWSGLIGGIGGLFGVSPEAQAREQLEARAGARMRNELARGLTISLDLCSGQVQPTLGALAEGEAPPMPPVPEERWIDNQEVLLQPGGLDIAGPYDADDLELKLERFDGPPFAVHLVCAEDGERIAATYLATGEARVAGALQSHRLDASLWLQDIEPCESVHLVTLGGETPSRFGYRARRLSEVRSPLVNCD